MLGVLHYLASGEYFGVVFPVVTIVMAFVIKRVNICLFGVLK